jgi:putative transposase
MPSKNTIREHSANSYYHVYNRGVEKRTLFIDDQDYAIFLSLLKRYLDIIPEESDRGKTYKSLSDSVELIAFCLMSNHFHLLLYQIDVGSVAELMRAVCSSYVTYFNKKYDRVGTLFQGKFRAVFITSDDHLQYLSRYIHRNPTDYMNYKWSSLNYWTGDRSASWIRPDRLGSVVKEKYHAYLKDGEDYASGTEDAFNITIDN